MVDDGGGTTLLSVCPSWLREIVGFANNTGMRRGEELSLKWPQVNMEYRTITILKPKNKQTRIIPMNDFAHRLLTKIAKEWTLGYVFPDQKGGMINKYRLRSAFERARKKAGLDDVRFHDLRHTVGSRMAQAGTVTALSVISWPQG